MLLMCVKEYADAVSAQVATTPCTASCYVPTEMLKDAHASLPPSPPWAVQAAPPPPPPKLSPLAQPQHWQLPVSPA